jgi:hypothetical protein
MVLTAKVVVIDVICFVNIVEGEAERWTAVGECNEMGVTATGGSASAALCNWQKEARKAIGKTKTGDKTAR